VDLVEYAPRQTGWVSVKVGSFDQSPVARLYWLGPGFAGRALCGGILVVLTHQFALGWLRFLTSEAILRLSVSLGLATKRVSLDTIRVQGDLFRFVVSCTFADVLMGAIPFVWNFRKSISSNLSKVIGFAAGLFGFNILRLEIGQLLSACGSPWILADEVLGGVAYFAVWVVLVSWFSGNWGEANFANAGHGRANQKVGSSNFAALWFAKSESNEVTTK
jgi:hypothetical protein